MSRIVGATLSMALILSAACLARAMSPPADVQQVWLAFRAAVLARLPDEMIALSRFPINAKDFGGDIGSPAEFKKRYRKIFRNPAVEGCFANGKLEAWEPKYLLNCDGVLFGFEKADEAYRFSFILNLRE